MTEEIRSIFLPLLASEERYLQYGEMPDVKKIAPVAARETYVKKGKLINLSGHFRFLAVPPHRHDFIEMAYVLNGSLTHIVENKKITLKEGDLLIMNRAATHSVEPCGKEDVMVNIVVLPEFFDRVLDISGLEDSPMRRFFWDCIVNTDGRPDYLLFNVGEALPIKNLIENLLWTMKKDLPYKQSTNQLTMALLLQLLQFHAENVKSYQDDTDIIWRVQRYIEVNYKDGDLKAAAKELNYDYTWLSRAVFQKTGKTFTELMQERRMQQAMYLLKHTDYTVEQICFAVGYTNQTYFYKLFKKIYSTTPKKVRNPSKQGL